MERFFRLLWSETFCQDICSGNLPGRRDILVANAGSKIHRALHHRCRGRSPRVALAWTRLHWPYAFQSPTCLHWYLQFPATHLNSFVAPHDDFSFVTCFIIFTALRRAFYKSFPSSGFQPFTQRITLLRSRAIRGTRIHLSLLCLATLDNAMKYTV